jgi:hypothetical protein
MAKRAHAPATCVPESVGDRRLYDLTAAARYLSLKPWTLRHMVYAGQVPTVALPSPRSGVGRPLRRLLFDKRTLDALVDNGGAAA